MTELTLEQKQAIAIATAKAAANAEKPVPVETAREEHPVSSYFQGIMSDPVAAIERGALQLGAKGLDILLPQDKNLKNLVSPPKTYSEKLAEFLSGSDKAAYGDETPKETRARNLGSTITNAFATAPMFAESKLLNLGRLAPAAKTAPIIQRAAIPAENALRATGEAIVNRAPGAALAGMTLPADDSNNVLANMDLSALLNVAAPPVARAIGGAVGGVVKSKPVQYFFQSKKAKDAAETLRSMTLSSVENAANIGERDVTAALNEAKVQRATPISTPALEARQAQYVLAQNETAASRAAEEAARKNAAALQAMEGKRVIQPIGEPATREAIGAAPQAEMLATKAAREKAASEAWTEASAEVDRIDASKQKFGTRIAYGKPFKDFIAFATKEANAPVGSPQTKAFYSKILDWFPEGNINAIKPSQIMELKRFVAEEANAPAQGFKAIAKERADSLYKQLDNILENHLTDVKTGVSPYAERRDAYSLYKDAWKKDYLSRYGKKFTAENISGDAISSGTDVARTLFSDPAAMRAAIADGASIPTLLKSSASHVANEFEGKSVDEIVKMLKPKTPLSNTLENVPELAPLKQSIQKYVQQIMDQEQAGVKISGFSKTADDFAKAASQSEKNAAVAQERLAKGTETRKAQLSRQVEKSMDTATTRQQALMDVQQLRGDLASARVKDSPKEIIRLAKSHFEGDQAMLDEIAKIEKMDIDAGKMRSLVYKLAVTAAGAGAGTSAVGTAYKLYGTP